MFKRIVAFSFAAMLAFCSAVSAADKKDGIDEAFDLIPGEFSADVTLVNDYTFRGVSQTGGILLFKEHSGIRSAYKKRLALQFRSTFMAAFGAQT